MTSFRCQQMARGYRKPTYAIGVIMNRFNVSKKTVRRAGVWHIVAYPTNSAIRLLLGISEQFEERKSA